MTCDVSVSPGDIEKLIGQPVDPELIALLEQLAESIITNCYGDSLDPELVEQLGLYLVAHYVSGSIQNVKTERIGPTYVSYDATSLQEVTGNPLSGTRWGQAVMALDPSGCITNGNKLRASLRSFTEYTLP